VLYKHALLLLLFSLCCSKQINFSFFHLSPKICCKSTDMRTVSYYNLLKVHMCMTSMKNILIFVRFWDFFHFFPNGREESISSLTEITQFLPWLLPSMEETCQPWMELLNLMWNWNWPNGIGIDKIERTGIGIDKIVYCLVPRYCEPNLGLLLKYFYDTFCEVLIRDPSHDHWL